jgi:hypothetical protein
MLGGFDDTKRIKKRFVGISGTSLKCPPKVTI